jgi:hypothetical protein
MLGFRPVRGEMEGIGDLFVNVVVIIAWCSIAVAIFGLGEKFADKKWQKECIDRGVATHDQKTGEWKWKND